MNFVFVVLLCGTKTRPVSLASMLELLSVLLGNIGYQNACVRKKRRLNKRANLHNSRFWAMVASSDFECQ